MKKFNINHYFYIQITEEGWDHLRKTVSEDYIEHCIEIRKVIIDDETWYKLQCHNVFDLFPMNFGSRALFNTNIMIDDSDLN